MEATTVSSGPLTKRQLYIVFAGLMTALALSALDTNIVGVALPTIVADLGGLQQIAWVGTAYLLTSTAATPLFGKLSDLYGRRRLFQVAIITFVFGSLLCAVSQNMIQLVLARGVQGIGGGGLFAMAFAVIGDVVPARERGRYVGFFTSVFALASVAGPLIGGFFVDNLSWRWIFVINVPLGAVALVVTSSALKLPIVKHSHKIDWLGATLLVGAIVSFILPITWGGEGLYGWSSPPVVGFFVASLVMAVTFVLWELRAPEPIVPMRLFRNQIFSVIVPMMIVLGTLMFGANAFLPLFLQGVDGVSATQSGLLLLPLMLGVTIASIGSGRRTAITGKYRRWPILGTSLAIVGVAMLTQLSANTSGWWTSSAMLLLGLGMGMTMPTATLSVQNSVEFRDMGVATGMVTFFRSLGGAIGLAVYGAVFNAQIVSSGIDPTSLSGSQIRNLPPATIDALAGAVSAIFVVALPLAMVAFVLAWFLKEIPLRETSSLSAVAEDGSADGSGASPADIPSVTAGAIAH